MSKDPTCPKRTDKNPSKENVSIFLTSPKKHPVNPTPSACNEWGFECFEMGYEELPDAKITFSRGSSYVRKFRKTPVIIPGNLKDPTRSAARAGWSFGLPNF